MLSLQKCIKIYIINIIIFFFIYSISKGHTLLFHAYTRWCLIVHFMCYARLVIFSQNPLITSLSLYLSLSLSFYLYLSLSISISLYLYLSLSQYISFCIFTPLTAIYGHFHPCFYWYERKVIGRKNIFLRIHKRERECLTNKVIIPSTDKNKTKRGQ